MQSPSTPRSGWGWVGKAVRQPSCTISNKEKSFVAAGVCLHCVFQVKQPCGHGSGVWRQTVDSAAPVWPSPVICCRSWSAVLTSDDSEDPRAPRVHVSRRHLTSPLLPPHPPGSWTGSRRRARALRGLIFHPAQLGLSCKAPTQLPPVNDTETCPPSPSLSRLLLTLTCPYRCPRRG